MGALIISLFVAFMAYRAVVNGGLAELFGMTIGAAFGCLLVAAIVSLAGCSGEPQPLVTSGGTPSPGTMYVLPDGSVYH